MKIIASALLVIALTGCSVFQKTEPKLAEIATPASLQVRCPDLPLIDKPTPLAVAYEYIFTLQNMYIECATRNDSSREINNRN